jgi:hypothetical protein
VRLEGSAISRALCRVQGFAAFDAAFCATSMQHPTALQEPLPDPPFDPSFVVAKSQRSRSNGVRFCVACCRVVQGPRRHRFVADTASVRATGRCTAPMWEPQQLDTPAAGEIAREHPAREGAGRGRRSDIRRLFDALRPRIWFDIRYPAWHDRVVVHLGST